jgi:hypothetical protein
MDTRSARAVSGWEIYLTKKAVRYRTGRVTGKPEVTQTEQAGWRF